MILIFACDCVDVCPEREKEKSANEESERVAFALIDWHQFVVVETITFNPDDEPYLPAPKTTIEEMTRMLNQQSLDESAPAGGAGAGAGAGGAGGAGAGAGGSENMDTAMDVDMEDGEGRAESEPATLQEPEDEAGGGGGGAGLTVRRDYDPSALARSRQDRERAAKYQKCQLCGEMIPIEELSEHMRYTAAASPLLCCTHGID